MNEFVAVDIVLLPDARLSAKCIALSRQYRQDGADKFPLNNKDNFPHLSLFFLVLKKSDLDNLSKIIEKIAFKFKQIPLTCTKTICRPMAGGTMCFLDVNKTAALKQLQKTIIRSCKKFSANKAGKKMFILSKGESFYLDTSNWVDDYVAHQSGKNFWPHITLRTPKAARIKFPLTGVGSVAVGHLGNKCTVRKILYKT